ncbi:oxygen-independent coproporphyrinogen III oxidase [Allorhizobium sp. BGMRC 0089]|uniref:oxygen-independent coproporphyrinogen III oxidase n=1 Tax=Allorhizobium sonneratiae TaxID=2934936 RepID=UPI0020336B97|nr:oxygen-independent coproporphyrinogen III oxidase [Allorhizobium sonneratiae]MCM2292881.1 oxygen-independent coproporphyrinogen III oxidase [Allorhizobium sonneratiae]
MTATASHNPLLARYASAAPRYTSYPTAPHFHTGIDCGKYAQWLSALRPGMTLSLYLHIPFCDRLCWFCACHTKHTLKYQPVAAYLQGLYREIEAVARLVPDGVRVTAVHFGGGSPTMLKPEDMVELNRHLRQGFCFAADAEISVEMDPNDMDEARYDALAEIGMTRASLGVQDFDPVVQRAINRIQTFEQTQSVVAAVRSRGAASVNCDILYGLPHQTVARLEKTVENILSLKPDRVALFGYAHVPWMKKHQTMIDEAVLPGLDERYAQMTAAASLLTHAGYDAIGIDHFALPDDSLAVSARQGQLRRNFQGYTTDAADALIGFGASSIGRLPQGYVQNAPSTSDYLRMSEEGGLAVRRGIALSVEDRLRATAIEELMCNFFFSFEELRRAFPQTSEGLIDEARLYASCDEDGLTKVEDDCFIVTGDGRPFVRTIAAAFDPYFSTGKARHSIAV